MGSRGGGFGAPVASPGDGPSPTFPSTVVGQSSTADATLTAFVDGHPHALVPNGPFTLGTPSIGPARQL